MMSTFASEASPVQDVESWNDKILSFRSDDLDPATYDRQIEKSLAALFDSEKVFDDLSNSCDTFYCSTYFPYQ